jgi:hypothetical protein
MIACLASCVLIAVWRVYLAIAVAVKTVRSHTLTIYADETSDFDLSIARCVPDFTMLTLIVMFPLRAL